MKTTKIEEKHTAETQSGGVADSCTYLVWGTARLYLASSSDGIPLHEIEALDAALLDEGEMDEETLIAIWEATVMECHWPGWDNK